LSLILKGILPDSKASIINWFFIGNPFNAKLNMPLLSKFDCIAKQVHQDLSEPYRIKIQEFRKGLVKLGKPLQIFRVNQGCENTPCIAYCFPNFHGLRVYLKSPLVWLSWVKDIVDHLKQYFGTSLWGFEIILKLFTEIWFLLGQVNITSDAVKRVSELVGEAIKELLELFLGFLGLFERFKGSLFALLYWIVESRNCHSRKNDIKSKLCSCKLWCHCIFKDRMVFLHNWPEKNRWKYMKHCWTYR